MNGAYDVSGLLPGSDVDSLPAGTNVLIEGPPLTGKRALALQLLAAGYGTGEGILCITTDGVDAVYTGLERNLGSLGGSRIGIVDTSGGTGAGLAGAVVESVATPSDLTGISMRTAKLARDFENDGVSRIRYGLLSVSTLLQYLDSQQVFKFLHVYTRRITETGSLGIYTLNSTHDPEVVNTIAEQFDGLIELQETDAGDVEFRIRGFGRGSSAWSSI